MLGADVEIGNGELAPCGWWTRSRLVGAKEQGSLAGDVDALVSALDARAALEIGITQALGDWLSTEAERDALAARLRAFTPLVRGTTPAHASRYIRASDSFHRDLHQPAAQPGRCSRSTTRWTCPS